MTEAIQWCNEILAAAPDDRGIEMPIAHALAHMHARLGNFELARSQAARCLEIANESGQRSAAMTLTEAAADVETLAGDHATAERMLAVGCDWFSSLGAPHAVLEAFHGLSQGYGHIPVDVQRLAAIADAQGPLSLGRLRGPPPQGGRALLEAAMAGAHLNEGRYVEAEGDARSAVAFLATTDLLTFHADSSMILGDILRATGRPDEAAEVFLEVLGLYEQKGSLVGMEAAAARLAAG